MNTAEARNALINNPSNFLKYYPLKCAGTNAPLPNAVNTHPYYIHKLHGDDGASHLGATRPGPFGHRRQISTFKLNTMQMHPGTLIPQAHVVPMVNYNSNIYGAPNLAGNLAGMPHYVLDGSGDGLMVTGELSNCCFCWITQGANLWCIHVQPVGPKPDGTPMDAVVLQNTLALHGHFAAAPATSLSTFGRNDYPGRASVVGVRQGGAWHLYAQTVADHTFSSVHAAYQIHPGAVRRL